MRRLYLDTEFNGFNGELMSLALVPAGDVAREFYCVLKTAKKWDPWVEQHVVPHLEQTPMPRTTASAALGEYLREVGPCVVVADWPTDFEHLMALLITGPGFMQAVPGFSMEYMPLPGFNTADHSRVPHNALHDARALRDYCEKLRRDGGPHS